MADQHEWSLVGVSIASIWWDMGLAFVLFLAALQNVPRDLYEAAEIDGASRFAKLRYVTLPHHPADDQHGRSRCRSSRTMRIFSQVYVMTNGGPAGSSSSVIYYIYQTRRACSSGWALPRRFRSCSSSPSSS